MTDAPSSPPPPPARRLRRPLVLLAVAGAGLAGALALAPTLMRSPADPTCDGARAIAQRVQPLARGEVAAVVAAAQPARLPDLAFAGPDGAPRTLADFRGRTVLLNLWATWCAPCRHEMPALDRLQAALGGADFEVVAVNIDTRNLDKPRTWLEENGIRRLAYYADAQAKIFQDLRRIGKAVGMPTTILIDPKGCEVASLSGPADWAGEDALRLVSAALGR